MLKSSIKLLLDAQALPQAIDAAMELADCFLHQGGGREAGELILSAMDHPACTENAKQRAQKLREFLDAEIELKLNETLETLLMRQLSSIDKNADMF